MAPTDWVIDTSGNYGAPLFLFSPLQDSTPDFRENINLMVQDLSAYDFNIRQFMDLSTSQIKKVITDVIIYKSHIVQSEDIPYYIMEYSGTQGVNKIYWSQRVYLKDKTAYVITAVSLDSKKDLYDATIAQILSSFVINTL